MPAAFAVSMAGCRFVGLRREQQRVEALGDQRLGDRELAELVALALRRLIDDGNAIVLRLALSSPSARQYSLVSVFETPPTWVPSAGCGTAPKVLSSADQSTRSVSVSEFSGGRSCANAPAVRAVHAHAVIKDRLIGFLQWLGSCRASFTLAAGGRSCRSANERLVDDGLGRDRILPGDGFGQAVVGLEPVDDRHQPVHRRDVDRAFGDGIEAGRIGEGVEVENAGVPIAADLPEQLQRRLQVDGATISPSSRLA